MSDLSIELCIIRGLTIFERHDLTIGADHEVIYAWIETPLSDEDRAKVEGMGWFRPDEDDFTTYHSYV